MRKISRSEAEMPFLDHLEELRWRIIWSIVAAVAGIAVGFFIVLRFDVLALLERPILPYLQGNHIVATHPTDGLQITISAAMWIGLVVALPVILYQAWLFLAPALYKRERRLLIGALAGGVLLFALGATFAYVVMLPMSLPWLFGFFGTALQPMITAENYFGFVFSMVLSFGVAFELPVVILLLAAAGLVTPQFLSRYRRHAVVLIVVLSAFLTPGDFIWSTLALSVPLYALYEVSVLAASIMWRRRDADVGAVTVLLAPLIALRALARANAARVAAPVFVALTLAGCSAAQGDASTRNASRGVTVRDSAGVEIVEHTAEYIAALPVWTIDTAPLARVAGDTPDNAFTSIRDAVVRPDGRFIVADQRQRDIREYTTSGTLSRVIIGTGRGPGEVGVVERLQLLPHDSLAFIDASNRRLSLFGPDGRFAGQQLFPRFTDGTVVRLLARLDDGRILGTMRRPFAPSATAADSVRRDPLAVVAFRMTSAPTDSTQATQVDTIAMVPDLEVYAGTTTEGGETRPDEYPLRFGRASHVGTGGRHVFIGTNEGHEIVEYGPQGPLRRIRNGTASVPLTAADRERLLSASIAGLQRTGMSLAARQEWTQNIRAWRFAKDFEYYSRLTVGSDGTLWAETPWVEVDDARKYVVYDSTGRALARAEFPARMVPLRMNAKEVLGTWKDEDDVPYVMRWRLRTRG